MKGCNLIALCFILTFRISYFQCLNFSTTENERHFVMYAVLRMVPIDERQLELLKALKEMDEKYELDFWKEPSSVNEAVDVMIPPGNIPLIEQFLLTHRIPRTVLINDVESYVREEKMEIFFRQTDREGNAFFSSYRRLSEIHEFVDKLSEDYPDITEIISLGKSSEGRDLKAIKLTNDYSSDEEVKDLVDHFDWYILPVVNPDGYEFSHNVNRMWRKSRRGGFIFCRGVDLNRNFGFHWKEGGSSSSPCSETYAGSRAFSEPETKAISDFLSQRKENFIAYLAVHSYSQLWLTPWGWTSDLPDDYDQMVVVAQEATQALSEVHGTKYRIGSSTNILYVATGGADDWAYGSAGIKYSYTLELRDTGRYGFLLPSEQIIPTGEETFAGIKAMAKAIKRE
ncbi:Carboxypeptidase A2, partial [Stegodyphus mimosarum]